MIYHPLYLDDEIPDFFLDMGQDNFNFSAYSHLNLHIFVKFAEDINQSLDIGEEIRFKLNHIFAEQIIEINSITGYEAKKVLYNSFYENQFRNLFIAKKIVNFLLYWCIGLTLFQSLYEYNQISPVYSLMKKRGMKVKDFIKIEIGDSLMILQFLIIGAIPISMVFSYGFLKYHIYLFNGYKEISNYLIPPHNFSISYNWLKLGMVFVGVFIAIILPKLFLILRQSKTKKVRMQNDLFSKYHKRM